MTAMHHTSTAFPIRPFREDDIPAIVALDNRGRPPVRRYTVTDWLRRDALWSAFYTYSSFEDWYATHLSRLDWSTDAMFIAEADGAWVALHSLSLFNRETGAVRVPFTGTLPAYRGRGLATALKVRGAEAARRRGRRIILTSNRVENAPVLAINRTLGFIPGPIEFTYTKTHATHEPAKPQARSQARGVATVPPERA